MFWLAILTKRSAATLRYQLSPSPFDGAADTMMLAFQQTGDKIRWLVIAVITTHG